jgi:hypothetical protein
LWPGSTHRPATIGNTFEEATMWLTSIRLERPKDYEVARERLTNNAGGGFTISFEQDGYIEIGVRQLADSAETATRLALTGVSQMLKRTRINARAVAVTTMRPGASERVPDVVGLAEAADILQVSKPRVSQLAKRADFPAPLAHLAMGPVYAKRAIRDYATFGRKPSCRLDHTA